MIYVVDPVVFLSIVGSCEPALIPIKMRLKKPTIVCLNPVPSETTANLYGLIYRQNREFNCLMTRHRFKVFKRWSS